MALVKCKECGQEVSDTAKTCPHCGIKDPGVTWKTYLTGIFFLVALGLVIYGYLSEDDDLDTPIKPTVLAFTIPDTTNPEAKKLIESKWEQVKEVCPGLNKYASSLKFDGIYDNFNYAPKEEQRATVQLLISEDDRSIPTKYGAWGHRCFYEISSAGDHVTILKTPCQSICMDRDMSDHDGDLKIPLKVMK